MMYRRLLLIMVAATFATWISTSSAEAQLYQKFYVVPSYSSGYVPHTTTHLHYVPHGNHIDVIPHTTTHYDRVNNYGSGYGHAHGYGAGYGSGYGHSTRYGSYYGNHNTHSHSGQNYWGYGHCYRF
jgi:hypothetical protein